ncbi:hypothetical protein [Pedobacter sp. Hv1]|uniref:hypothetical protein n=1 Tax=Pedobacter sp. Hv1 TaxID=1740090 RepID=UPI0006D8C3BF|nr:hypothetical protein [Pedobacter sp. Hv1]KQC01774.1 hypothetical protein AQF98_05245 [Pedobacter sp. Hv1]
METLAIKSTFRTRSGVTEQKKAELDELTIKVIDAQHNVAQFQAIVDSLTEKSTKIQGFLATDEEIRSQTYNNKLLIEQMVQNALDLKNNSQIAVTEMAKATTNSKDLAPKIKVLIDKLIYVAEIINKLSNIIIRKKALNPLISDDLITMVGVAGKNANDAVALTLIALKSTFAAQASNRETEMAMALELDQAKDFYHLLTGTTETNNTVNKTSLTWYLDNAYTVARGNYKQMEKAYKLITKQLGDANADLNKAQVKLKSLQAGLAAANAAALAS